MSYQAGLLGYLRRRDRGWVLSLFAAVCLIYAPFLGSPFIFDDYNFFDGNAAAEHYAHAVFNFDLRWLPYASLGWTYAIFSAEQTYFYHAGNLLLHAANVIALFYLLRQWLGAVIAENKDSQAMIWGAWLAALIFAIHPVAVYAVGYVIQRSILMATLFALLMQIAYLRSLLTGQKRWLALAVAAYFMAVFSKEHSVMMPAVLLAQTLLVRDKIKLSRAALWAGAGAFAAVGLLIVMRVKVVLGAPYEVGAANLFEQLGVGADLPHQHLLSALTQAGLFFKYLWLWLLPNPAWMSIDMREPFVASLTAWQGWLGALGFIAYGAMAVRLLLLPRWRGLLGLALLYPWLQFIVEFSSIRIQEPFILYRSYLWMPGLLLLVPLALSRWPGRKAMAVMGLLILVLVPLTINRLWVLGDSYRLWDDAARLLRTGKEPLASRIYYNRAVAERGMRRWDLAIPDYEKAIAQNAKEDPIMIHDLGVAYFNTGRLQEALVKLDRAIELNPDYAKAYYDRGMTLKFLGRKDEAMLQMEKSCELKYLIACLIVQLKPQQK